MVTGKGSRDAKGGGRGNAGQGSQGGDFVDSWAALPVRDRRRVRRLVRLGRPVADEREARLAVSYAAFQRARMWVRFFWLWFVPGVFVALGIASRMHPMVIGIVLALSAQAVFTHRNLKRVEAVNAGLIGG